MDEAGFIAAVGGQAEGLSRKVDEIRTRTDNLVISANGLSSAMTRAFMQSVSGGKQLDDVLKGLALRLSGMAVAQAFKPLAAGLAGWLDNLFKGLFGGSGNANPLADIAGKGRAAVEELLPKAIPFAAGGVIGAPTYFPMSGGGLGLAGEAGTEAIMPLMRGSDGRLGGAAANRGMAASITVHIATPDAESFRRSETYVTGQIARAVARGQRSL